jgi:hypothetical protein
LPSMRVCVGSLVMRLSRQAFRSIFDKRGSCGTKLDALRPRPPARCR